MSRDTILHGRCSECGAPFGTIHQYDCSTHGIFGVVLEPHCGPVDVRDEVRRALECPSEEALVPTVKDRFPECHVSGGQHQAGGTEDGK